LISGIAGPASATLTFHRASQHWRLRNHRLFRKVCSVRPAHGDCNRCGDFCTVMVVSGMAGGVAYACSVTAANTFGASPASNSVNVTPLSGSIGCNHRRRHPTRVVGVNSNVDVLVVRGGRAEDDCAESRSRRPDATGELRSNRRAAGIQSQVRMAADQRRYACADRPHDRLGEHS
jgi:hypothetical protein